ncbi:MAG: hypothetical protein GXP29_11535, partial [Planctomycetes bacterium]|nr:hypothetical protein [Planctomycetota bacterium]
MSFLEQIFDSLKEKADEVVVAESHQTSPVRATGGALLAYVQQARRFVRQVGVCEGRRCALIAPNSIHRVAFDLAI